VGSTGGAAGFGLMTRSIGALGGAFGSGRGARGFAAAALFAAGGAFAALALGCGLRALATALGFFLAPPPAFFAADLREFVALAIRDHANVCTPSLSNGTEPPC
jgi:hypothetical protein